MELNGMEIIGLLKIVGELNGEKKVILELKEE
jgi:hypothetical protein